MQTLTRLPLRTKRIATRGVSALVATLITTFAASCDHASDPLFSPVDAQTLAAIAPDLTVDRLVQELQLPESSRAEFATRLASLHQAMTDVHARIPKSTDGMPKQELEKLHTSLQTAMQDVHRRHHELLLTLDEERRE
jgi:hypothetical protein